MKTYKLLRDMPTVKAGTTFREITREVDGSRILKEYKSSNKVSILVSEVNDFDEWFEKIEPTDSVHWKPKKGDKIWYLDENGNTNFTYFDEDDSYHLSRFEFGNTYRTSQECEKARERRLAEVRLQQTSNFKPDPNKGELGWIVGYDHEEDRLLATPIDYIDYGEPIRYATEEEAKRSIRESRGEWLKYFGIEEEE